jgi:hypothetical protein
MLDPVTGVAATQDCPSYDRDSASADCLHYAVRLLPLLMFLRFVGRARMIKCSKHLSIYPLLTKHLDMSADNLRLPLLGFAFPGRG